MDEKKINYSYNYNLFTLKSKGFLIFAAVSVILLVSALSLDFLKLRRSYGETSGMSQQQVIRHFYNAVNTYNIAAMQNCINSSNVTVMNNRLLANTVFNTRRNMEEITHGGAQLNLEGIYISPDNWIEEGKPQLKTGEKVEGINNLIIKKTGDSTYEVTYDYYFTKSLNESETSAPEIIQYTDICEISAREKNWIIEKITQL